MFMLVVLLVGWLHAAVDDTDNNLSVEKVNLAKRLLPEMCPGANVCLDNYTTNGTHESNFKPGQTSCCAECSCDPDCEKTRTCCFPLGHPSTPEAMQPESVCLYPMIPQPQGDMRIYYSSYKMVSHVPKPNASNNNSVPKCGDENVAPWGSFLPVFSRQTKTIYKNSACAQAAGVTDGKLWHVQLSCKYKTAGKETNDVSSYISDLYLESLSDKCEIHFDYPGEISDLNSEICFEDLISTCPQLKFDKPQQFSQLTRKEIRQACKSRLVSPYRLHNMYANVFCHICNGMYFQHTATCNKILQIRGKTDGRFVCLIDGDFMSHRKLEVKKETYIPQACFKDGENEPGLCRKVYCPSGQIRDTSGECIFPAKTWYIGSYAIYIKLTADEVFDIAEIHGFSNFDFTTILPLVHTWPKNWIISTVSYKLRDDHENKFKTLYVKMVNVSPITDPTKLLNRIHILLKLPWTLTMSNDTRRSMSAEMMHTPDTYHVDLSALNVGLEVTDANITTPKYVYVYENVEVNLISPFVITRLYFCEQILLNTLEFELLAENAVLWNKITNQTFFIGDFSTVQSSDYRMLARICLSDSGFMKRELLTSGAVCAIVCRILVSTWISIFIIRSGLF